jgi:hypothetical protein
MPHLRLEEVVILKESCFKPAFTIANESANAITKCLHLIAYFAIIFLPAWNGDGLRRFSLPLGLVLLKEGVQGYGLNYIMSLRPSIAPILTKKLSRIRYVMHDTF